MSGIIAYPNFNRQTKKSPQMRNYQRQKIISWISKSWKFVTTKAANVSKIFDVVILLSIEDD